MTSFLLSIASVSLDLKLFEVKEFTCGSGLNYRLAAGTDYSIFRPVVPQNLILIISQIHWCS